MSILRAMAALAWLSTLLAASPVAAGPTLDIVRQRGAVVCGINPVVGMATIQADGRWAGFLVDFCRAFAAAALGDAERIEILAIDSSNRFTALKAGTIDVLVDGATWTLGREADLGVIFPVVYFYDGQGFLAHKDLKAHTLTEAGAASICTITETTSIANLEDYLGSHPLPLKILPVQSNEGGWSSFLKRRCDIMTNDVSGLIARRALHTPNPDDYVVFDDVISKEPLGPAVRADDPSWTQLVRWAVLAMIAAEEKGVTQDIAASQAVGRDPEARALVGLADDHAKSLGLQPGWARQVVRQVGNFGEVFDRHLGARSALKLPRGVNRLWTQGGLLYAPPFK
jgi:general L-amino acid transport system substrate-binding protein